MVESESSPIKPCIVIIHLHCCYSSEEAGSAESDVAAEAVSLQGLTAEVSYYLTQNKTYPETGAFPENNYGNYSRRKSIIACSTNFCCKS